MRYLFSILMVLSVFASADSITVMGSGDRSDVYVSKDAKNYRILHRDGTAETISVRRVNPETIKYSESEQREAILRDWKAKQGNTSTSDTASPRLNATLKKDYDPAMYAESERFKAERSAYESQARKERAQKAEAIAKEQQRKAEADRAAALKESAIMAERERTEVMRQSKQYPRYPMYVGRNSDDRERDIRRQERQLDYSLEQQRRVLQDSRAGR